MYIQYRILTNTRHVIRALGCDNEHGCKHFLGPTWQLRSIHIQLKYTVCSDAYELVGSCKVSRKANMWPTRYLHKTEKTIKQSKIRLVRWDISTRSSPPLFSVDKRTVASASQRDSKVYCLYPKGRWKDPIAMQGEFTAWVANYFCTNKIQKLHWPTAQMW